MCVTVTYISLNVYRLGYIIKQPLLSLSGFVVEYGYEQGEDSHLKK